MSARTRRSLVLVLAVVVGSLWSVAPAAAQARTQVVSANPFGLLLELFNAEYERAISPSVTAGLGGSFGSTEDENGFGETEQSTYFNGDIFVRFYPSGQPFDGWNFGVKVGVTQQDGWASDDETTNFGYGFDANRSWLLGHDNNFYVGVGFGLKRLVGEIPADGGIRVIPTLRIINVGFAF